MPEVVSDILVSNAAVLYSPLGTALPADTLAAGGAWPAGWAKVGFTLEPLKATYEYDVHESMIQESLAAVKRRKTKEAMHLETVLAELNLELLKLAWEGTVTQTAAGTGQPGKEELTLGDVAILTERQWGFEGQYVDEDGATFPVRMFIWKATAEAGGELGWSKEAETGTPLKIAALADMTKAAGQRLFKLQKILEPAT